MRIEDAGYMDEMGRIWLVGRVKWRVERDGRTFWSTVVEQKVYQAYTTLLQRRRSSRLPVDISDNGSEL